MIYEVKDPTLRSVAQGESVYPVEAGKIDLPESIAADLLATGQIAKPAKDAQAAAPAPKTKKSKDAPKDAPAED